jgi:hypothetical protein
VEHPSEDEREDIDVPDDAYYGAAAGSSDHNTYGGSYGSAGGDIELPRSTYSEGMRRFNERTRQVLQQIHEEEEEQRQQQQQQQQHGQPVLAPYPAAPPNPGALDLAPGAGAAAAAGGLIVPAAGCMHWHVGPSPAAAAAGAAAGSELQQQHYATYGDSYDNRMGGYSSYAAGSSGSGQPVNERDWKDALDDAAAAAAAAGPVQLPVVTSNIPVLELGKDVTPGKVGDCLMSCVSVQQVPHSVMCDAALLSHTLTLIAYMACFIFGQQHFLLLDVVSGFSLVQTGAITRQHAAQRFAPGPVERLGCVALLPVRFWAQLVLFVSVVLL